MKRNQNGDLAVQELDRFEWITFDPLFDLNGQEFTVMAKMHCIELQVDDGSKVSAYRLDMTEGYRLSVLGKETVIQSLQDAKKNLNLPPDFELFPQYNCHGLVFAESRYWINDISVILCGDNYNQMAITDPNCKVAVFTLGGSIVHSAEVLKTVTSKYSKTHEEWRIPYFRSKTGVRAVVEDCGIDVAARGNRYDSVIFYGKLPQ